MAQNGSEEIEGNNEEQKIRTKLLNKFLSDYFGWIIAAIVAVVFLFGFFFLLLPKYEQTIGYLNAANQQQVLNVSAKQDELNKIQRLLAGFNSIDKKSIAEVNSIAPTIQNKEELFSELNYLISVNQLFLQSVSLSAAGPYQDGGLVPMSAADQKISSELETVNITLTVVGTNYESFKNLLASLEDNLRLMDVVSVGFSPQEQSVQLNINTYYSKE